MTTLLLFRQIVMTGVSPEEQPEVRFAFKFQQ